MLSPFPARNSSSVYQLVDFGNARKLESFSGFLIDRPSPAATGQPTTERWHQADGRFELQGNHKGCWDWRRRPNDWKIDTPFGSMELFPNDFGHLGVFMEQASQWEWLNRLPLASMKILNLFGYTGGSSLAAAKAGACITHVDSAKNMVRRASNNAKHSGMEKKPIRWIVEDARKFVQREMRRGNQYDGVILDPPTYGHGVSGKTSWKIEDHLPELFDGLCHIIPNCQLLLFTCHSPGFTPNYMAGFLGAFPQVRKPEQGVMALRTPDGRNLENGHFVRWFNP